MQYAKLVLQDKREIKWWW